tara:strand:- start:2008 stop:2550 length:543 start_codon:yes stop_codon:yes gene_type:complete
MIHNIVTSISDRLDEYVKNKLSLTEDAVIISSIVDIKGNVNQDIENKICVFLLNIEEEKVTKNVSSQIPGVRNPVSMNLYLMFSAYFSNFNYLESLQYISIVIEFFQNHNYFDNLNTPMLSNRVDKLYAEFNNISMDEINKLWSNIGANYVPSVSYKIKHARFDGTELFENIPNILGRNR